MFVFICYDLSANDASTMRVIFKNIQNYKNVFDLKNAFMFLEYEKENHKIKLFFEKKSFYDSLYILSKRELKVLRDYFSMKNLILDRIREFINSIETSMLFTLKSDESLKSCIDYREFNAITIKNRHSLSFIEKTLNRLMNVVYFTKLDLKNAYYKVRIRQNDK